LLLILKRYREIILVALLLVLPMGVYLAHAKEPWEVNAVDRVVLAVTYPLEKAVAWAVTGALKGWRGYVAVRGARAEAARLGREVGRLERERQQLLEVRGENDRLRALLGFAQASPDLALVGARVIGLRLDPKGALQLITLDRGSSDGIAPMMPVITADGLLGRVHAVFRGTSDVLLLVDRNSSVAARVERSRARANVRGLSVPDVCRLDYVLRSEDIMEGDALVTSGTDGIYPRGLKVGRVTRVKRGSYGLYQTAEVIPAVNVTRVEEVLVVTSRDRRDAGAPAARAP
jgi:rod shape-determining protein MreC